VGKVPKVPCGMPRRLGRIKSSSILKFHFQIESLTSPMSNILYLLSCCLLLSLAQAVLPPGYEDELYCPPNSCLRRHKMKQAFVGPRSVFHECWNEQEGTAMRPKAWGSKLDPKIRSKLLEEKWHVQSCAAPSE